MIKKIYRRAGGILTGILVLAVLAVNIWFNSFSIDRSVFADMTSEGLYTLSDEMREEASSISSDVTITFCADPDVLLGNYDTRYVYRMALQLSHLNEHIKVRTVNVQMNPTAVQEYQTTSVSVIEWDDVIVSSDTRYKILSAGAFWTKASEDGSYWAFNGEYKMACAMLSVTSIEKPLVCLTYGHGEYDPYATGEYKPYGEDNEYFYRLLTEVGLTVQYVNLDEEEIPEDCVLLIVNGATEDYVSKTFEEGDAWQYLHYVSPVEKMDRYLDGFRAMMVFRSPNASLPVLESFLREWGISYSTGLTVEDPASALDTEDPAEVGKHVIATYADSENNPLGNSFYSEIADLAAAPKMIAPNSGFVSNCWGSETKYYSGSVSAMTDHFILSTESAHAVNAAGEIADAAGGYGLAAVTVRQRAESDGSATYQSYLFAAASTEMLSDDYLGNDTYANYDILFAVIRSISRTDEFSVMDVSINSDNYGGKILAKQLLSETDQKVYEDGELIKTYGGMTEGARTGFTVAVLILPVLILPALCIRTVLKRRHK